jgi:hypothetical protein
MRPLLLVLIVLALTPVAAAADSRWTFCVASALPTRDVWISEVFATALDRERVEGEFKAAVIQTGAKRVVAQCPASKDDKTAAVNDRFGAVEFNRQLGADIREVSGQRFPPRR